MEKKSPLFFIYFFNTKNKYVPIFNNLSCSFNISFKTYNKLKGHQKCYYLIVSVKNKIIH